MSDSKEGINDFNLLCNEDSKTKDIINKIFNKYIVKDTIKDYTVLNLIGKGVYGNIYIVSKNIDNKLYSVRSISKRDLKVVNNNLLIKGNRPILELIDDKNIVKLDRVFQNNSKLYLLSDYCDTKDLWCYINKIKLENKDLINIKLKCNNNNCNNNNNNNNCCCRLIAKREIITLNIINQILDALSILHSKNIIYKQ